MLDEVDQLGEVERLRQDRGRAHLQQRLRLDAHVRGEHDHRHVAEAARLFQPLQKIPAVHVRHRQVEQHHVGIVDRQRTLTFRAVAGEQNLKAV
ncbi:MAG TPA: hypothetical protein VE010_23580, partial [Thermoanaerobaculia bacterium]|nr:hypothetical protein [Thermoanaerobaculia bacterium]